MIGSVTGRHDRNGIDGVIRSAEPGTGIARARELHLFDAATGDRLGAERGPRLCRQVPKLLYVVGTLV
jgi:hypothetical protein